MQFRIRQVWSSTLGWPGGVPFWRLRGGRSPGHSSSSSAAFAAATAAASASAAPPAPSAST